MPTYEYRCVECDVRFEQRIAAEHADEVTCGRGHRAKRLLSTFAVGGQRPAPMGGGGGCCGGACGCG